MDANFILQLGPLQIPITWLIIMVGLLISTIFIEKIARKRNWKKEQWTDLLIILFTTFLLIYKFGWALFDIKRVINNPAILLWTSGSTLSIFLAITITLIILFFKIRNNKYPLFDLMDFGWLTLTFTLFIYSLFLMDYGRVTTFPLGVSIDKTSSNLYHPVNWYNSLWIGLLLIMRFSIWLRLNYIRLMSLYVMLGVGLLLISVFDHVSVASLVFGMMIKQWIYFLLIIIGGIGFFDIKTKDKKGIKNDQK